MNAPSKAQIMKKVQLSRKKGQHEKVLTIFLYCVCIASQIFHSFYRRLVSMNFPLPFAFHLSMYERQSEKLLMNHKISWLLFSFSLLIRSFLRLFIAARFFFPFFFIRSLSPRLSSLLLPWNRIRKEKSFSAYKKLWYWKYSRRRFLLQDQKKFFFQKLLAEIIKFCDNYHEAFWSCSSKDLFDINNLSINSTVF